MLYPALLMGLPGPIQLVSEPCSPLSVLGVLLGVWQDNDCGRGVLKSSLKVTSHVISQNFPRGHLAFFSLFLPPLSPSFHYPSDICAMLKAFSVLSEHSPGTASLLMALPVIHSLIHMTAPQPSQQCPPSSALPHSLFPGSPACPWTSHSLVSPSVPSITLPNYSHTSLPTFLTTF